jgi:DNA-binding HxlR family transcriptional regulator
MLSDRLRILEAEGLVERKVIPDTPVRVEYQLTVKGRSLEGALGAIGSWAETWIDPLPGPELHAAPPQPEPAVAAENRQFAGKPRIKPKLPV